MPRTSHPMEVDGVQETAAISTCVDLGGFCQPMYRWTSRNTVDERRMYLATTVWPRVTGSASQLPWRGEVICGGGSEAGARDARVDMKPLAAARSAVPASNIDTSSRPLLARAGPGRAATAR